MIEVEVTGNSAICNELVSSEKGHLLSQALDLVVINSQCLFYSKIILSSHRICRPLPPTTNLLHKNKSTFSSIKFLLLQSLQLGNVSLHGAMGHVNKPLLWTQWAVSYSSQSSTTGVTKAVVCTILSVGW